MTAPYVQLDGKPCAALNPGLVVGRIEQLTTTPTGMLPRDVLAKAAGKRHPLEKELLRLCECELTRRGIIYLHLSPMAREKIGWPDLVFVTPTRPHTEWEKLIDEPEHTATPWAIELKQVAGRVTPEQEAMLAAMNANGWHTEIIRSYEDFRMVIFGEPA